MTLVVAVTQRVVLGEHAEARDALAQDWGRFFDAHGIEPVLVPNALSNPARLAERAQAVLLTGGGDVPALPGESAGPAEAGERMRWRVEEALLDAARARRLPVLAVCRGFQAMNVCLGGGLVRDLSAVAGADEHVGPPHAVRLSSRGLAEELQGDRFRVNTFHRQGVTVDRVAPALRIFAVAASDVVEGVAHRELPWIGVQWHPERTSASPDLDRAVVGRWLRGEVLS